MHLAETVSNQACADTCGPLPRNNTSALKYILEKEREQDHVTSPLQCLEAQNTFRTECSHYALVTDYDSLKVVDMVLGGEREVERGFTL